MTALQQPLLHELRQRLETERGTLQDEITAAQSDNVNAENQYDSEFSGYSNHMAETGTEIFEQERNLALKIALEQQLSDVNRALEKFEQGSYGICDACGKEINSERLQALPQALLCLPCREDLESQR